jgi:hypothetical protein
MERKMGVAAREHIEEAFTEKHHILRTEEFYYSLVSSI